jgi:hypothetical protein
MLGKKKEKGRGNLMEKAMTASLLNSATRSIRGVFYFIYKLDFSSSAAFSLHMCLGMLWILRIAGFTYKTRRLMPRRTQMVPA